jgi:hypothetical protein
MKLESYYRPTPKRWRKIGDALLASAALIGGGGLIAFDELKQIFSSHELKIIIGSIIILGIAGKFLTNFFKEETNTTDNG